MQPWSPETSQHEAYFSLTRRIQAAITSPRAQIEHQVNIAREPGESPQHWGRLLDEIGEAEGVTMTQRENGSVDIAWFVERNE